MLIIDTKSSNTHFIISYENGKPFIWINKQKNTLEMVINQLGKENIKEVI